MFMVARVLRCRRRLPVGLGLAGFALLCAGTHADWHRGRALPLVLFGVAAMVVHPLTWNGARRRAHHVSAPAFWTPGFALNPAFSSAGIHGSSFR